MKFIFHIYCSYTNIRKGHPHACRGAHTCLILLPTGSPYSFIRYAWNLIFRDYFGMSLMGLAKMNCRY